MVMVPDCMRLLIGYMYSGCFQTAYFYGRLKGVDIRKYGSGNAGTTNMRCARWAHKAGIVVFCGDVLKAIAAVVLDDGAVRQAPTPTSIYLLKMYTDDRPGPRAQLPVLHGHFHGGKGVAVTGGFMLAFHWTVIPGRPLRLLPAVAHFRRAMFRWAPSAWSRASSSSWSWRARPAYSTARRRCCAKCTSLGAFSSADSAGCSTAPISAGSSTGPSAKTYLGSRRTTPLLSEGEILKQKEAQKEARQAQKAARKRMNPTGPAGSKGAQTMAEIGMIGAGSWGTALTYRLTGNGHRVEIWSIAQDEVDMINTLP
jgi:hypothetical protein